MTLNLTTQGNWDGTIVWEYWNGTAWTALAGIADGTSGFEAAVGNHDVTFTVPTDWAIYEIEGYYLYWIRARVSVYNSITTQPKGGQAWVNTHFYDLHSKATSYHLGSELINNGGMENGNPPTGWISVMSPETFERSAAQKHGGNYSAHIVDSTPSYGGMIQLLIINSSSLYKISGWFYVVSGTARLQLGDCITGPSITGASWNYVEYATLGNGGVLYCINNSASNPAEFYVDDVSIREILTPIFIYDNETELTEGIDYYFLESGGAAGADRIQLVNYPTTGHLLTSDFTGYLRIKAKFSDDTYEEEYHNSGTFILQNNLRESNE
jgi:hypothetical protein